MYNTPFARPNVFGRLFGSTKNFNFSNFLILSISCICIF